MERIYSIYKITNLINNKSYIGQSKNTSQRWSQHKLESKKDKPRMLINKAMKKYGIKNFNFEVIASCKNLEDANDLEVIIISQIKSHVSTGKGYNISPGGSHAPKTEEWKLKISKTLKGHFVSEETKEKQSISHIGQLAWNKGMPRTEKDKLIISNACKGRLAWNKKFSQEQELIIANDKRSSRVLAKIYSVNKSTILDIKKRNKK